WKNYSNITYNMLAKIALTGLVVGHNRTQKDMRRISMAQYTRELFQPNNFNLAFEQMCNFAAIANTRNADETLKQLIMQCFVVFPRERLHNAAQLADAIMAVGLP